MISSPTTPKKKIHFNKKKKKERYLPISANRLSISFDLIFFLNKKLNILSPHEHRDHKTVFHIRTEIKQKKKRKKEALKYSSLMWATIFFQLHNRSMGYVLSIAKVRRNWDWRVEFKFQLSLFHSILHKYPCNDVNPSHLTLSKGLIAGQMGFSVSESQIF